MVPVISLYEVFKRVAQQRGEGAALQAVAIMQQVTMFEVDPAAVLAAARISLDSGLPPADSMMLAASRAHNDVLWTQDADLADLPGVMYIAAH